MFCVKCGGNIKDGDLFCPKCGAKVKTEETAAKGIFCVKCGNKIKDGMLFCTKCGTKAEAAEAAAEAGAEKPSKEKKSFDTREAAALVNGYVSAVKSDKKLLTFAGAVLAVILIIIFIIVSASANGKKSEGAVSAGKVSKGDFYFDRKLKDGEIVEFGEYEQDGNTANGKEPIRWRVVSAENDRYLLLSVNILDFQAWDNGSASGGYGGLDHDSEFLYQDSSIRRWLNEYFDEEAFGEKERKYIIPVSFRNDVITVDKNNQYGRDLAFLLNDNEVALISTLYKDAQITLRLLKDGTYARVDLSDVKNYSETDWYGTWYIRNTDKYTKEPTVFYWDRDASDGSLYTGASPSEKNGIRPAVYISSDACYKKSADEIDGDAIEKMSEYKGKYFGGYYEDPSVMNYVSVEFKQGFIDIASDWPVTNNKELDSYLLQNNMRDSFSGKYNMSDFDYSKEDGKDCFTDESRGIRFIYDSKNDNWLWYLNIPAGTTGFPEDKTEQWLLYQTLISESEYKALRE